MPKTTLEILSERRQPTVLLDPSGRVTTLDRLARGTYKEIHTFENALEYAESVPADTSEEYLRLVDEKALLDYTPHYYETHRYDNLRSVIGYVGLELALRYTTDGARFSTLEVYKDGLHTNEHFLAVSPSIYFAASDARDELFRQYGDEISADSY